jgi:hypothetical protein
VYPVGSYCTYVGYLSYRRRAMIPQKSYQTTRHHTPGDRCLHIHWSQSLKCKICLVSVRVLTWSLILRINTPDAQKEDNDNNMWTHRKWSNGRPQKTAHQRLQKYYWASQIKGKSHAAHTQKKCTWNFACKTWRIKVIWEIWVCIYMCVCVYIYIYTHTYIHTHTYIYIYIYKFTTWD